MLQPSKSTTASPELPATDTYTPDERHLLLEAAHRAIISKLQHREISLDSPTPHLSEPRGVFTTLYLEGNLRGCVGYPLAVMPLYQAVLETARAAAFEDPRFLPLTLAESHDLAVSLSVLSPIAPISPEEIQVGRHGLLISDGSCRGLLLPQVASEHGWDRVTFLEQTCRKAGLSSSAWRTGAKIEAFTAEVFGDPGV